jgi:hypothetical protein
VLPRKDLAFVTSPSHHCLGVTVCCLVRDGKLATAIALNVGNGWILLVVFGRQWQKGSKPIHRMTILVQAIPTQEVCARPAQFSRFHWHRWPRMPATCALLPLLSS